MDNNDIRKLRHIKRGLQLHTQHLGLVQLITSHTDSATERKAIGDMLRSNMRLGLPNVHKMIRIMLIIVEDDVIAVPLLTQAEEQIRNLIAALSSDEATLEALREYIQHTGSIKAIAETITVPITDYLARRAMERLQEISTHVTMAMEIINHVREGYRHDI